MDRTVDEVVEHLLSLTPEGSWTMENGQDVHLIFTGGEPLLGWQKFYTELLEHPRMKDLKMSHLKQMVLNPLEKISEIISTIRNDLQSLGVVPRNLVLAENLKLMLLSLGLLPITLALITVNSISSLLSLIVWMWMKLQMLFRHTVTQTLSVQYIVCRLGGRSEEYSLNVQQVAELCMERGWRFTPRLHISLFGNAWGT